MKWIVWTMALTLWATTARGEVAWDVSDGVGTVTGSGTYTFEQAPELSALRALPDEAGIELSGAGLSFADDACISKFTVNELNLNLPLTAAGDLTFQLDTSSALKIWRDGYLNRSSTTPRTLFPATNLDDYDIIGGEGGGTALTIDCPLVPFHIERGTGWLTAQLQAIDGGWAKCVKIRLEQRGEDIVGWIVYAKYLGTGCYGVNFDAQGNDQTVSQADDAYGFGVTSVKITLSTTTGSAIRATRPIRVPDGSTLRIADQLNFVADGEDVLGGGETSAPAIDVRGSLTITNITSLVFDRSLTGNGKLTFGGKVRHVSSAAAEVTFDKEMPTVWTKVAEGQTLKSLRRVKINDFSGGAIHVSQPGDAYFLKVGNNTAVCQCQGLDNAWIKGVYLDFRQAGDDIEAQIRDGRYTASSTGLGVDWDTLPLTGAGNGTLGSYTAGSNPATYSYGLGSITMFFDAIDEDLDLSSSVTTAFTASNGMTVAAIVQNGGIATVSHLDGLPASGTYTVNGGELVLQASGAAIGRGVSYGRTVIRVVNGVLSQKAPNMLDGARQEVFLDNSELRLLPNMSSGRADIDDSDTYVNRLTLKNGSRVTTKWPRIGYNSSANWTVRGTSPSWCDCPLLLASTGGHTLQLDIADVTGDAAPDLVLKQGIRTYDSNLHTNIFVCKIGAGTVSLDGTSFWFTPIQLQEGTMRFGATNVGKNYLPVNFAGGALELAANTSNAVGRVTLAADSALTLEPGAILCAGDSADVDWQPNCRLTVRGDFSRTSPNRSVLRFGESNSALTADQLSSIRWQDDDDKLHRMQIDAQGYLTPVGAGFTLIVR